MSQLRLNPLTGRWVTIVAERAERPSDFAPRLAAVESDPDRPCPFCPGHEEATMPGARAASTTAAAGACACCRTCTPRSPATSRSRSTTSVRCTSRPRPAAATRCSSSPAITTAACTRLNDADAADLMRMLQRRFSEHSAAPNLRFTQAIINHGREAGASLVHPHGQLLGLPFVPGRGARGAAWLQPVRGWLHPVRHGRGRARRRQAGRVRQRRTSSASARSGAARRSR